MRWQAGGLHASYERPVLAAGAVHLASLSAIVSFDPSTGRVLHRRPAEMVENLTAAADVLYWRDSTTVYAAKAKA